MKAKEKDNADFEMDGLAKLVGLDIEKIAIQIATGETEWPDIFSEPRVDKKIVLPKVDSKNSTPNHPIKVL